MRKFDLYNAQETGGISFHGDIQTTDIAGLGTRFELKKRTGRIYEMEHDFEDIALLLIFGMTSNAIEEYRQLADFIATNGNQKLILKYDAGDGTPRFCEVWPRNIPKTQQSPVGVYRETIVFARDTPWYTKETSTTSGAAPVTVNITNTFWKPVDLEISVTGGTAVLTGLTIYLREGTTEKKRVLLGVTTAVNITIDGYEKRIYNGGTNLYGITDKAYASFLSVPKGTFNVYVAAFPGGGSRTFTVKYRKWVAD